MAGIEREFVEWLRHRRRTHTAVTLGIGDDMAILARTGGPVLVSSDMLLDGIHFDTDRHDLSLIGRKAIACSLSDCAAMAVRPIAVTVSIALSSSCALPEARRIYDGIFSIAQEYDVVVAGGDTTRWDHPLAIDVAITATPYEGVEPVRRSGARIGDTLYVTGPLGGSSLGRHLTFAPRVTEARKLAETLGDSLHAMMDISDGLSLDLWRICEASGVAAVLDERQLEAIISEDARRLSGKDATPALDHALSDGEDFELLLAIDGGAGPAPLPLWAVGQVHDLDTMEPPEGDHPGGECGTSPKSASPRLAIRRMDGRVEPLEPTGYLH